MPKAAANSPKTEHASFDAAAPSSAKACCTPPIGGIVRAARTTGGMTVDGLAKVAGVSRRTIFRLEGEGVASEDTLLRIGEALALPPGALGVEQAGTDLGRIGRRFRDRRRARGLPLAAVAIVMGDWEISPRRRRAGRTHVTMVAESGLSRAERGKGVGLRFWRSRLNDTVAEYLGFDTVETLEEYLGLPSRW